jgi:cytochrome c biogenesis factor
LVLFSAAWLLRSRVPATLGLVIYAVLQVALLGLFTELQPSQVDAEVIAAGVNFACAALVLSFLPRGSRRRSGLLRHKPRRSLPKLVFSAGTVTTMLALIIIARITNARIDQGWSPALLITAVVAIGIFAGLAHLAASVMNGITWRLLHSQRQVKRSHRGPTLIPFPWLLCCLPPVRGRWPCRLALTMLKSGPTC